MFPPGQGATIGVDFLIKTVEVDGDRVKVREQHLYTLWIEKEIETISNTSVWNNYHSSPLWRAILIRYVRVAFSFRFAVRLLSSHLFRGNSYKYGTRRDRNDFGQSPKVTIEALMPLCLSTTSRHSLHSTVCLIGWGKSSNMPVLRFCELLSVSIQHSDSLNNDNSSILWTTQ